MAKRQYGDGILAAGILVVLAVMIVPIPTFLLDLLLVLDIGLALVILLMTVYTTQPLRFNVFPTLLLLSTLYRLSLNVASTRTILLNAYGGKVIEAFGNFVVGGNYAVGIVAFIILAVIQFVVITKGASRIAEVAARFTLDAMPGRQMAIDADLNAGLIDEHEARTRRQEITRTSDFYGAMDGAAKFVRGDAVAAIIITIVNIVGGFVIGMIQHHMSAGEALRTYTLLTIGDGLVAQIPALVVATGSGILITRSEGQKNLANEISTQLFREPKAAFMAAAILAFLGLIPGLPFFPFLLLAALAATAGWASSRSTKREEAAEVEAQKTKKETGPEKVEQLLAVDPLELEIGFGLIPLVDETREGGDLLKRVTLVRRQCATDLGLLVPPVRVRDNIRLAQDLYRFRLKGVEIAKGQIQVGHLLAMSPGANAIPIEGIETQEPVFGLKALWILPEVRGEAEMAGYTVVEPTAVMATHLSETIKAHAGEILGRQEVQTIIDQVKTKHPAVVDELIPGVMTVGGVQKVLQRLLNERVSIRDMVSILEALADHAPMTKDLDTLVERVREALGRGITEQYRDERGGLAVISIDPELEQELIQHITAAEGAPRLTLPLARSRMVLDSVSQAVTAAVRGASQPVLLCSPYLRPYLRSFVERALPQIAVLSYAEVVSAGTVKTVATVKLDHAHQAI
ncbi:MAG: flagellar biosynthesis protein FlhA [Candidatus Eisenbacteria bacterium]|nr:flagellar biosynthesis protein FlhA [Candidatus Eisenbacteria bacterium]MCC7142725.1 flagellar biosynthesis protein FlhA [Candidatus Eisenbacteria bacterium]